MLFILDAIWPQESGVNPSVETVFNGTFEPTLFLALNGREARDYSSSMLDSVMRQREPVAVPLARAHL